MQKKQKIPMDLVNKYIRTNYRVVGKYKHTSIKPCHWMEQKLLTGRENRNCYKGYWGIDSETCIQNSPAYPFCNHSCVFCWRDTKTNYSTNFIVKPDDPEYLINELIRQQLSFVEHSFTKERSLQNLDCMNDILKFFVKYAKTENVNQKKWKYGAEFTSKEIYKQIKQRFSKTQVLRAILLLKNTNILKTRDLEHYYLKDIVLRDIISREEGVSQILDKYVTNEKDINATFKNALKPKHAAISLDGEPTLYPNICKFVDLFRNKRFTTFIVSNGTTPEVLLEMNETGTLPSILYITLPPPKKTEYTKVCRPRVKHTWDKIQETLKILKELNTRTVLRITSVNHINIEHEMIAGYAKIIEETQPDFVDVKGFTLEGSSMQISDRLSNQHKGSYYVPTFQELLDFSNQLCLNREFEVIETHEKSRDILIRVNWPKDRGIKIQENEI
ncbi:MAG: radical SAM protein [Candidatus Lokiarchaeota archaeon]|nr:radical SAM protein [Candidatus Lokiarchaeota archaeon]